MGDGRLDHYDVTGKVCIEDPVQTHVAVSAILARRFPDLDLAPLADAFAIFTKLFAGELPGYVGCDTWYHDAQHSLDCTLAFARLADGHEERMPEADRLGGRRLLLGVIIALFHDSGYIRKSADEAENGAEYTLGHVKRSGDFLAEYLPRIGFGAEADLASRVVHFTGYEVELDHIEVRERKDRMLGFLLGTADIMAQFADRCYLEKCRDFLAREFKICGLVGPGVAGGPKPIYRDAEHLLRKSGEFHAKVRQERLDGYFECVHRYMAVHFGGSDPYAEAIFRHEDYLEDLVQRDRLDLLRRKPSAIGAEQMRTILRKQAEGDLPPFRAAA